MVTPQRASLPGSDGGLDGSEGGAGDGENAGDVGNDDEAGGARLSMASSGTGSCSEFPPLVQKMIKLDNQERLQMNIAPLTCDDDLGDIAFKWSKQQCECEPLPRGADRLVLRMLRAVMSAVFGGLSTAGHTLWLS